MADTDALLYLPGRDHAKLRVALQIHALSPGWQDSFRGLLAAAEGHSTTSTPPRGPELAPRPGPAWPAFRKLRVAKVVPESATVSSICLAAVDGTPLPAARAGQYLTLRIPGAGQPAPVRSYSLSSAADAGTCRISVKQEPRGIASSYLNRSLKSGAVLDVAAPRGDFVLDDGTGPILLISAGIGVTPVLSMLHQLAAQHSKRDIWWLHGARSPREHPFAAEAHALLASLPHAREHVFYSAATPPERHRVHAAGGRLTTAALAGLAIPASASAYVCGPASFMIDMQDALTALGIDPARIRTELFGALPSINPGLAGQNGRQHDSPIKTHLSGDPPLMQAEPAARSLITSMPGGDQSMDPDQQRSRSEVGLGSITETRVWRSGSLLGEGQGVSSASADMRLCASSAAGPNTSGLSAAGSRYSAAASWAAARPSARRPTSPSRIARLVTDMARPGRR